VKLESERTAKKHKLLGLRPKKKILETNQAKRLYHGSKNFKKKKGQHHVKKNSWWTGKGTLNTTIHGRPTTSRKTNYGNPGKGGRKTI